MFIKHALHKQILYHLTDPFKNMGFFDMAIRNSINFYRVIYQFVKYPFITRIFLFVMIVYRKIIFCFKVLKYLSLIKESVSCSPLSLYLRIFSIYATLRLPKIFNFPSSWKHMKWFIHFIQLHTKQRNVTFFTLLYHNVVILSCQNSV